jgi:phage-related protein
MASDRARKILVAFYRTRSGAEVVRDWLRGLDAADRNAIGQDLMRVQYRWPVGMPLCRALGDGLWEVRSTLPGNRIGRVLFSVDQDRIIALHGFIKKTRKTPADDLALARKRKREFER